MFYVFYKEIKGTQNGGWCISKTRINSDDEEFNCFRDAIVCVNRHKGIVLDDSILDKYFPPSAEQLKFNLDGVF